jgi:hypothetical protein
VESDIELTFCPYLLSQTTANPFAHYILGLQGCEGWALFLLTKVLKWRSEEVQVFIAKFRNEVDNRSNHAYYRM